MRDLVGEDALLASQRLLSFVFCIKWRSCPTDQPSSLGNPLMNSGVYKVQTSTEQKLQPVIVQFAGLSHPLMT